MDFFALETRRAIGMEERGSLGKDYWAYNPSYFPVSRKNTKNWRIHDGAPFRNLGHSWVRKKDWEARMRV
jgi:hypothetical protein